MAQPVLAETILSLIADLERRLVALERSPQLTSASIENGALTIFDDLHRPVLVFGKQSDGRYGMRVNNSGGAEVLRLGEVAASTYGLDAKDPSTGNLVQRLVNGLLTIYDASAVARVKVGKDGSDYDVKSLDAAGANAVALSTLARGQAAGFISTNESTSSTSYTDLTTDGPEITLTIGPSGRAIIHAGAAAVTGTNSETAALAMYVDGNLRRLWAQFGINFGSGAADIASGELITGLSAGSHTFKLRYKSGGGNLVSFSDRWLTGWAF